MKLSSRRAGADEEVLGEQEALSLPLLPQREGAQADLTEHAALAAGRQLDERACPWTEGQVTEALGLGSGAGVLEDAHLV